MWGNIKLSSLIERTKGSFPSTNINIERLFLRKNLKIGLNIFCEIVNILNPTRLRREPCPPAVGQGLCPFSAVIVLRSPP